MNQCIEKAKFQDLYHQTAGSEEARNPYHVLWCHVLLLIRTLSSNLIDDGQASGIAIAVDTQAYLKKLLGYIQSQGVGERISAFLCYQLGNPQAQLTHAVIEELELLVSILCQLFMQADQVAKLNYLLLQGLKDCLLFGLTQFFTSQRPDRANSCITAASQNEKYLQSMNAYYILERAGGRDSKGKGSRFTLLDLKAQVSLVKIYMSFCAAVMNLILQDKATSGPEVASTRSNKSTLFPMNWQYLSSLTDGSAAHTNYIFHEFAQQLKHESDHNGYGALLKLALEQIIGSHDALQLVYQQWRSPSLRDTEILFDTLRGILSNDESLSSEYHGLNSLLISTPDDKGAEHSEHRLSGNQVESGAFHEFMDQFEAALDMGGQLQKLMLEKVQQCREQS